MGRSGPEFTTDADLAAGLFAPSLKDCSEADIAPGGRPHRQLPAGRTGHMAAAGRQNPERSSGTSQRGLAGLSGADAAGLVQPAVKGSQRPAAASADGAGTAGRTSLRRDGAWSDGNADAGTDIGRQRRSV